MHPGILKENFEKFTPVMQQYLNAAHDLPDNTILLFRMGDFYEAFFEDAKLIAKELEITLTGRAESNYPGGRLPMAGVPAKAVEAYVARLLEKGYRVCVAEQMADPSTCKGLVPREITKTYTPGTIAELNLLSSYKNNFIAAVNVAKSGSIGLAYADISTGEFYLTDINGKDAGSNLLQLQQELARIAASEILIPAKKDKIREGEITARSIPCFDINFLANSSVLSLFEQVNFHPKLAEENIKETFGTQSLAGFGLEDYPEGIKAAGGLIEYFKETQQNNFKNSNFDVIKTYQISSYMMLDANTRRNLELVKTLSGNTDGSLLWAIDRTASNLGKRRLRSWLEQPLYDLAAINERQEAVAELFEQSNLRQSLSKSIDRIYDIERLANRLFAESINPRELIALKDSLLVLPEIVTLLENSQAAYLQRSKHVPATVLNWIRQVDNAITEQAPNTITEGGILRRGFNEELDEYISLVEDSQAWLESFMEKERNETGIKNLKVGFNRVHGYFIEISKSNLNLIPERYHAKQTMVNASRFITAELKEFEEKITNAESRRNGLEHKLFLELRRELAQTAEEIKAIANNIANLDALNSLAQVANEFNYSRPQIFNNGELAHSLTIKEGRHPVIEQKLSFGQFVANDIKIATQKQIIVLTGPNMAGKSTYMRQNALIILLAQIGGFVPAAEAKIGLTDRIFTRIGASDDLASGQSTFMVEMTETASILNGMTDSSFVILDEIGRGTSTYDGISIAWSIVEYIAKNTKTRTVFATHYHELADLEQMHPNVSNCQMTVAESLDKSGKSKIEFLHKVAKGSANRSYGIDVAKLAGLPQAVLTRAHNINTLLQARDSNLVAKKKRISSEIKEALNEDGQLDISKLPLFQS